jgi:hypothetical protein
MPIRTYPKINAYLFEDFVLLVPSGHYERKLKRQLVLLKTQAKGLRPLQ